MDLNVLLQQGGLAALAVAEALAIVQLWRQLRACQDARTAEKGAVVEALHEQATALERLAEMIHK